MTTADILREDVGTLVLRMLQSGGELFMFGEDGFGQYGRSDQVFRGAVGAYDISVTVDDDDNPSDIHCLLKLYVVGYDSRVHGHAITDRNLEICLDTTFKAYYIDPDSWDWADISMQGNDYIALNIDIPKFLDWA